MNKVKLLFLIETARRLACDYERSGEELQPIIVLLEKATEELGIDSVATLELIRTISTCPNCTSCSVLAKTYLQIEKA